VFEIEISVLPGPSKVAVHTLTPPPVAVVIVTMGNVSATQGPMTSIAAKVKPFRANILEFAPKSHCSQGGSQSLCALEFLRNVSWKALQFHANRHARYPGK
jgi:hypothetical protein